MTDPNDPHLRRRARVMIEWPRAKLWGLEEGVRQDLFGVGHGIGYLRNLLRGNRVLRSNANVSLGEDVPVLLIHGYLGTRGALYLLEQRLKGVGLHVYSFNLGTLNIRDIRRSATLVERKVESILARTSAPKIDIIGHSMGGLIGLYYVKKLGGEHTTRKLLMMGTPIKGTWAALLAVLATGIVSPSAWQLLPGSSFLRELESGPLPGGVEYFTITARRDRLCPARLASINGAEALSVPFGHASLVVGTEAFRQILRALGKSTD